MKKSCCRIANAYIQSGRIINPTERKRGMSEVKLKEN